MMMMTILMKVVMMTMKMIVMMMMIWCVSGEAGTWAYDYDDDIYGDSGNDYDDDFFLATLVALHLTPVSKSLAGS